jgi:cell fate regulator YaaT (PSP1 superfamily)
MPIVVGVSFKKAGKIYYFDPGELELHEGDFVIAETSRGIEFGEVMIEARDVPEEELVPPLRKIIRKATPEDLQQEEANREKEKRAFEICQQKIEAHGLPMKLIDAEYCFDGSLVTFYFSAESRVDFRELVKDLCSTLKMKVQLYQVGVRDEAKLFGGIGPCGRALCCTTFLSGFEPVSMKMAKEQSLFLNPLKFSGICGRLMCCLKYEYPVYLEIKSRLPALNSMVMTPKGEGKVVEINVIKEVLGVQMEDGIVHHFPASEVVSINTACQAEKTECCNACKEANSSEGEAISSQEHTEIAETQETAEEQYTDEAANLPQEAPSAEDKPLIEEESVFEEANILLEETNNETNTKEENVASEANNHPSPGPKGRKRGFYFRKPKKRQPRRHHRRPSGRQ